MALRKDIADKCGVCQTFGARALTFKVSIPADNIVFNEELDLDLFWLSGRAALHVVDIWTGYGNVTFLKGQTVEDVWRTFVEF